MGALERLIKQAERETGGSRRAAQFLLSLRDGDNYQADLQALLIGKSQHLNLITRCHHD